MSIAAIVHILNEEPVLCDMDDLPQADSQVVTLLNPRRRDGKELHYLEEDVIRMLIPWHRINFIQVMPSTEVEDVIGFVRE